MENYGEIKVYYFTSIKRIEQKNLNICCYPCGPTKLVIDNLPKKIIEHASFIIQGSNMHYCECEFAEKNGSYPYDSNGAKVIVPYNSEKYKGLLIGKFKEGNAEEKVIFYDISENIYEGIYKESELKSIKLKKEKKPTP
jgi:hypothetical protein